MVLFVTSEPEVLPTSMRFTEEAGVEVEEGSTVELHIETNPFPANATITYTSATEGVATVEAKTGNNKVCVVTGVTDGTSVITATCGNISATYTITVVDAE